MCVVMRVVECEVVCVLVYVVGLYSAVCSGV